MKILVVVPFAFHRASGSSLSTYFRILSLLRLGHHVDVICYPHGEDLVIERLTIIRAPQKEIFKFIQPGEYRKKIIYDIFLFLKTMNRLFRNEYDIIIPHGTMYYWTFLLIPFHYKKLLPNVHGKLEVDIKKWGISGNKIIAGIVTKIESFILSRYKNIICEHKSVYDALAEDINGYRLHLIRMATISVNKINVTKAQDKFTILYTGTFVKVQNLDLLIKTAVILKGESNIIFKLVGGIKEEINFLNERIKAEKLSNIILIERLPYNEVEIYLNEADVVVSPRTYGFDTPMKIIDYLNFGKCIIATNLPIHLEILNNENAYLVEPTPKQFADLILLLKKNPHWILEKELIAKKYYEQNFRLERMVNDYNNMLDKIYNNLPSE